jgi:hypothetical protein
MLHLREPKLSPMRYGQLCCKLMLVLCLLFSFSAFSQLQKIYLNPKAAGSEKQSNFLDSIHFVPLEIKEGIELGAYNNVAVTDNHFLITDYIGKFLLLYKRNGDFVKQISYKKLGENMHPDIHEYTNQVVFFGSNNNYALTPKDEIKIRLGWNDPHNKKYYKKYILDLADTAFIIKKDVPAESDLLGATAYAKGAYWQGEITTSPLFKDSLDYELKIYKNNRQVNAFFPYNRVNETRFLFAQESSYLAPASEPDTYLVTRPFCDTIYRLVSDSLYPSYQVVMPLENSLPASFYKQPFKNNTERENFMRNNGWMFQQVYNFYETPRVLFYSVRYLSNYESYVYVKGSNTTYKTKNVKADSSQFNLSLLGDYGTLRKGHTFYKLQKASELIQFFAQHKGAKVPEELDAYLKRQPHSASPVIVEFKFKN